MRFVVTEGHTRMALAIVRELGEEVCSPEDILSSASLPEYNDICHKSVYAHESLIIMEHNYAKTLLKIGDISDYGRNMLFPTGMYTLNIVAEYYNEIAEKYCGLWPALENLKQAADKLHVAQIANTLGISIPEEYPIDSPRFPCVLKYRNGESLNLSAIDRYAIANNPLEYEEALSWMQKAGHLAAVDPSLKTSAEIFVSEYVQGEAFGVSAVLDENSDPLAVFSHKRVREYPISGGPASCAESIWHPPLIKAGLSVLKALKLKGFAMAEFKGSLENPYLLEVNPRVWGTYPLARLSKANMVKAYVNGALGNAKKITISEECPYIEGLRMQFLANDLCHFGARALKGRLNLRVIWDMVSPKVKGGVFDKKDWPANWAYVRGLF